VKSEVADESVGM